MEYSDDIRDEFKAIVEEAHRISADVGREVEDVLREGREHPLGRDEAHRLLSRVITVLRNGALIRRDDRSAAALQGDVSQLVRRVMAAKDRVGGRVRVRGNSGKTLDLVAWNGIEPGPVFPRPTFHG